MKSLMMSDGQEVLYELRHALGVDAADYYAWLENLDDIVEPPLYYYLDQVEILRRLPEAERAPMLLRVGLEVLLGTMRAICAMKSSREWAVCLTVRELDEARKGERLVPVIAVSVDPRHGERSDEEVRPWRRASSARAKEVEDWLATIDSPSGSEFVVREVEGAEPELARVYIGLRKPPSKQVHM